MTALDWLIVAATALFAVSGYLRGFIVGALSLIGFVVGAIVGTRIAGALLSAGGASPYAPVFGLLGALAAGTILAMGLDGIGVRLRRNLHVPFLGVIDGLAGAVLSAAVALGVAIAFAVIVIVVIVVLRGGGVPAEQLLAGRFARAWAAGRPAQIYATLRPAATWRSRAAMRASVGRPAGRSVA